MNIAHLLPYTATFPLTRHNGRYDWVLRLARLQASQGHNVTIYCSPDSSGDGLTWRSIPHDLHDKTLNNTALFHEAFSHDEHDIFHSHFDSLHYLVADSTTKPMVVTQHWFPSQSIANASHHNISGNVLAVPVTRYMEKANRAFGIRTHEKIYHGIDLSLFTPSHVERSDRLISVGRIAPHKGVQEAVYIALAGHSKLDIVGKINDIDRAYWNEITPFVDGEIIRYLGLKSQPEVVELLGKSKAFLFPSQVPEAFGQTIIEAQACGTPVIVSDVGASSELIKDGITGFIASTQADFLRAIENIKTIDPNACREFAEQFDIHTMVSDYDRLYTSLL